MSERPGMGELVSQLRDEQDALDSLLEALEPTQWDAPSRAQGWSNRDCVSHLAHIDEAALVAVRDPGRFERIAARARRQEELDPAAYLGEGLVRGRGVPCAQVLAWWRDVRTPLLEALKRLDPAHRLPWYAKPMSARSFATARLMETWAHGLDVFDAVAVRPVDTDRLRHVALLGCLARGYAYEVNGLEPPSVPVRVQLRLPSGAPWEHGPPSAGDRVAGDAGDFCRVVVRRRHVADTALDVRGEEARRWMRIAQAYAGPPGSGRQPA